VLSWHTNVTSGLVGDFVPELLQSRRQLAAGEGARKLHKAMTSSRA